MDAQSKIRQAMKEIYDSGTINAAQVYKGTDYGGAIQATGWWMKLFGQNPTYLGKSVAEALETIEQIHDSREE